MPFTFSMPLPVRTEISTFITKHTAHMGNYRIRVSLMLLLEALNPVRGINMIIVTGYNVLIRKES
jgi:hypothetical protein